MALGERNSIETSTTCRKYFVVDAFADPNKKGTGNPAAVVPVDCEPSDVAWMQVVAQEMNLSETAFVWNIPQPSDETSSAISCSSVNNIDSNHYRIRYFTPTIEVDLCGHATLASAAILCNIHSKSNVVFHANNNVVLRANQNQIINTHCAQIAMTFPTQLPSEIHITHDDRAAVDTMIQKSFPTILSKDIIYVGLVHGLSDLLIEVQYDAFLHDTTRTSDVNIRAMNEWNGYERGIILCCAGSGTNHRAQGNGMNDATDSDDKKIDFYSRFFGPKAGIDEDPVTGSAHCALAPYFGKKLQKLELTGQQSSVRGGIIHCELSKDGTKVTLSGTAVTTAGGTLWM
jgi:predicted PhzF superfamily epimerase YddE/YHI9